MRKIKFSKLNGQGNDFIVIDATVNQIDLSVKQINEMCNRNFGIGADGLIIVKNSGVSDLKMEYFNRDGSIAEMCGNGIRCMAKFAHDNNLIKGKGISIETIAGVRKIWIDAEGKETGDIRVNMGVPEFSPENIPVNTGNNSEVFNYKIYVGSRNFYINCVSMGNPHCVIFLSKSEKLDTLKVREWGSKIELYKIFPKKVNVEFVKVKNKKELNMRVWERGVGETLACGTGACAAAVCAIKLKKVKNKKLAVNLLGGKINIIWNSAGSEVFLEGKVNHNYDGEYCLY